MDVWRKWSKKKKAVVILCPSFLLLLVLAMFLPEFILKKSWDGKMERASISDKDFQGDELQVTNTNMNFFDKVVLLNQNVDKNEFEISDPSSYDCMSLGEAVIRAREKIAGLVEDGVYPVSLEGYQNWYTYSGSLYQYTEQYFSNYSCFVWKLVFKLYDGTIQQVIHMDAQTGRIFKALVIGPDGVSGDVGDTVKTLNFGDKGQLYQMSRSYPDKFYLFHTESMDAEEIARAQEIDLPEYDLTLTDVKAMVNAPETLYWTSDVLDNVYYDRPVSPLAVSVVVPDKEGMLLQKARRKRIPESDIQKWYEASFPEGTEYNPPGLVDQVVRATQYLLDVGAGDDSSKIDYRNFLQYFKELDEEGDKFKYSQLIDYYGHPYPNFSCLVNYNGLAGYCTVKDTEVVCYLYTDGLITSGSTVVQRNGLYHDPKMVYKNKSELTETANTILPELQICEEFMDETGLTDYELESIYFIGYSGEHNTETVLQYSRSFDNLTLTDVGTLGLEYNHEHIILGVRDGMLCRCEIGAEMEPEEILTENVQLLPFSQIQESIQIYLSNNDYRVSFDESLSIKLEYAIIDDPENKYESTIVPVWNCYTSWETDNGSGVECLTEYIELSVNAIDGSIVTGRTLF